MEKTTVFDINMEIIFVVFYVKVFSIKSYSTIVWYILIRFNIEVCGNEI